MTAITAKNSVPARSAGGWMLVEALVSLGIVVSLTIAVATMQLSAARANRAELARQQCLAAAQASLDSIAATGGQIDAEQANRLWPGVRLEVSRENGQGDWQGLTLVRAAASQSIGGRSVNVELARYIATKGADR